MKLIFWRVLWVPLAITQLASCAADWSSEWQAELEAGRQQALMRLSECQITQCEELYLPASVTLDYDLLNTMPHLRRLTLSPMRFKDVQNLDELSLLEELHILIPPDRDLSSLEVFPNLQRVELLEPYDLNVKEEHAKWNEDRGIEIEYIVLMFPN